MSTDNPLGGVPLQPHTPGRIRPSARAHWRTHFYDHPQLTRDKNLSNSGGKPKVYCKACFSFHLVELKSQDAKEVNTSERVEVRSHNVLVDLLWDTKKPRDSNDVIGWIRGETSTGLNHLRNCPHQPEAVREEANADHRNRKNKGLQMGPPTIALVQAGTSNPPPLGAADHQQPHYFPVPVTNGLSSYLGSMSSGSSVKGDSRSNSPYPESFWQTSSRSSSVQPYSTTRNSVAEWSTDRQNTFNVRLGRLTASAGLPMSWIENPEFILFCQEFVHPAASIPGRKALSRRILPTIKRDFQKKAQAAIKKGALATIQGDGWSAINEHHLNAFMMTVERKIHTLRVHDSSGESKTAEKLLELLESVIIEAETKWKVRVVAVCTDASGESRKARKLLKKKFPYLVTPDCYAHQINLVVGDFFKSHSSLLITSTFANELITWLRSKSQILALLREKCRELRLGAASILRAVITRWTAHYLAYRRLLDLHRALQSLVLEDACRPAASSVFIKGPTASKAKARAMVNTINDNAFWGHLAAIKRHLEPLAIAANVTQSTFCRVDEVLLTFGDEQ